MMSDGLTDSRKTTKAEVEKENKELLDENNSLRSQLKEAQADNEKLNQMLRETGQGQGAIDAYAAQCEELKEANEFAIQQRIKVKQLLQLEGWARHRIERFLAALDSEGE